MLCSLQVHLPVATVSVPLRTFTPPAHQILFSLATFAFVHDLVNVEFVVSVYGEWHWWLGSVLGEEIIVIFMKDVQL